MLFPPIVEHASLGALNTFGFEQRARRLAVAADDAALIALLRRADAEGWEPFVLGGGSNLVLTRDVPGLVIRLGHRAIDYEPQPDGRVHVTAGAGVDWHALVLQTLDRGLAGLENLSLIPGTCGAAPVQNIGAYGVELADRLVSVRAWHRPSAGFRTLDVAACEFAYRDSRFKRERSDWIIVSMTVALAADLPLVTGYASLAAALAERNAHDEAPGGTRTDAQAVAPLDARAVSDAVIAIRRAKLPDPAVIGNAGSFFHNPIVDRAQARSLRLRYPKLVSYPVDENSCKLAAGWLIDQLGYRGVQRGAIGVHRDQALVLVHRGGGTGTQLLALVEEIKASVRAAYAVDLTVEPLIL